MEKGSTHFDLVVIGSGPAGQKAAIAAAKLGKRVAIVDRKSMLGGVCLHTATIPSKTLREAILYLTGFRQRTFYGKDYTVINHIEFKDLMFRVKKIIKREKEVLQNQLKRNRVKFLSGIGRFLDSHTLEIKGDKGSVTISADFILIACGTRPARPVHIPFEKRRILDSDDLVEVIDDEKVEYPRSIIVVGAGVIGLEYASMASALGLHVTIIEARDSFLSYVDTEVTEALSYQLRRRGVVFRLGEKVVSISIRDNGQVAANLESEKTILADRLLYAVGRQGNTDTLHLESAGISMGHRGLLKVNENFQTEVSHIYAAGDVIGHPSLASTSMEQGRLAAYHMFGVAFTNIPELLPYGIYTIPEISMVGKTEQQLTEEKVPYEIGQAPFEECTKAQIIGEENGFLKLIFHTENLNLLGVHIIGDGASELVHIGQMVMTYGGTIEVLQNAVFNYPTLAQTYKTAAMNGLNRLKGHR